MKPPAPRAALLCCIALSLPACGNDSATSTQPSSTETAPAEDAKVIELTIPDTRPVLKTEDLDSGKVPLDTIEAPRLMKLLNDLKERRDFDRSQHDNHPGPDGPYLEDHLHRVITELQRRNYPINNDGTITQKP